jgi:pimeloyl-ACP methyl ester carboxylesterase
MPFVTLSNGDRIYHEIHGPDGGRNVMLIHGWCASGRLYSEQVPALLEAGYRVILFDSAGHGRSSKKTNTVEKDVVLERLDEFAQKVGLHDKPFALIGHSAGGGIAQQVCLKHPDLVECVVFLNTGYKMCDSLPRKIAWAFSPLLAEISFGTAVKLAVRPAVNAGAGIAAALFKKDPRTVRKWFADVMRTRGNTARMEIEEIMRHTTEDELPNIKCPALVIGGSYDLLAPARQSRVMSKLIPNSELHILPTGHTGKMFQSELVNPLIIDFLKRNYPAAAQKSKKTASKKTAKRKRSARKKPARVAEKNTAKKKIGKKKQAKRQV